MRNNFHHFGYKIWERNSLPLRRRSLAKEGTCAGSPYLKPQKILHPRGQSRGVILTAISPPAPLHSSSLLFSPPRNKPNTICPPRSIPPKTNNPTLDRVSAA